MWRQIQWGYMEPDLWEAARAEGLGQIAETLKTMSGSLVRCGKKGVS